MYIYIYILFIYVYTRIVIMEYNVRKNNVSHILASGLYSKHVEFISKSVPMSAKALDEN